MIELFVYLIGMGLIVLGALAFIAALRIPGRIRMAAACLAAAVPAVAGYLLLDQSGLKFSDWDRLLRRANQEMSQMNSGIKRNQSSQKDLLELLDEASPPTRSKRR